MSFNHPLHPAVGIKDSQTGLEQLVCVYAVVRVSTQDPRVGSTHDELYYAFFLYLQKEGLPRKPPLNDFVLSNKIYEEF